MGPADGERKPPEPNGARSATHPRADGAPSAAENGLPQPEETSAQPPERYSSRVVHTLMFGRVRPGHLVAREQAYAAEGSLGRAVSKASRFLFGKPLASVEEGSERVGVFTGLAIFASDNISSSAYATEEIMRVLVLAGLGALSLTMPITIAICVVLAIVVASYQQVIRAYPSGGGSYVVASDNLGPIAGLTAGAALLTDYILTVAVSIAAGIAAVTSVFPSLYPNRVAIMVAVVVFMTIVNLRGIRESGKIFAVPTYVYLVAILALLGYGMFLYVQGALPHYTPPPQWIQEAQSSAQGLGLLLLLRAFASGSVALTGTEAVSNGVPAFKRPEVPNAQRVLLMMGTLFAIIFLGMSFLAGQLHIVPDPTETETVVSQLARTLVGQGPFFYLVQFSTFILLGLAANTSFNGFPRLTGVMAQDRYLPRLFVFRGDRLAYTAGVLHLAVVGGALIVIFGGSVTNLIPLYTVGVFIAFTLSQAGMVRHWWRLKGTEPGWRWRAGINALGAMTTGLVTIEVSISKFALGAWLVLALIPLMVATMWLINTHYRRIIRASRPETPLDPVAIHPRVVVPIANLNVPARQALAFARAIADERSVLAVHVTDNAEKGEALRQEWNQLPHGNARLVVIESPYRALGGPLLAFIDAQHERHPDDTIIVVLPEYVPGHWWEHFLHNQTAFRLKAALLFHPGVIVANVPYHAGYVET
jgi:amino acid transporter